MVAIDLSMSSQCRLIKFPWKIARRMNSRTRKDNAIQFPLFSRQLLTPLLRTGQESSKRKRYLNSLNAHVKWIMDKQFSKLLPDGFAAFENQVAGHNSKDGFSPTGILISADGYVLKPITKHPQSETEIGFYENITHNSKFACFRKFVPEYKGTTVLNIQGLEINFLKLQDITKGYVKPCVMDVKIGARTWDPNASDAKRKTETEKYQLSKKEFGFCIPGYQVYNLSTKSFNKMGKEEGRTLDKTTLPLVFREYLNVNFDKSKFLMEQFLKRLNEILNMWLNQTEVHIYSSSLLFTYDAHRLDIYDEAKAITPDVTGWINIMMIDFAHVVPANNTLDSNYISGLTNLIKLFEDIISDK